MKDKRSEEKEEDYWRVNKDGGVCGNKERDQSSLNEGQGREEGKGS